jgi:16S rRNA (cytosine967-C5)-methyltransferase
MQSKGLKYRAKNDPRIAALQVLGEVLQDKGDSQAALDRQLKESILVPSDKALCTELVYGVLRLHLRLSWFLYQKLTHPRKLPQEMLLILELAAYEIAHLRIPAHASVNFAVGFLRNRFGAGLAGVGNAVLRHFQRSLAEEYENKDFYLSRIANQDKGPSAMSVEFLAVFYAMPEWIVRLWLVAYGEETTRSYLAAGLEQAPTGVRVNLLHPGHKSLLNELKQSPGALFIEPATISLPSGTRMAWQSLLESGRISRQSAAAYEVLNAMRPETWDLPIWDACSGRGGKSMALLEQGVAIARVSDASQERLKDFSEEFKRLFSFLDTPPLCPEIIQSKAQEIICKAGQKSAVKFGTILLDVPCSGFGTLAHRPEIRWRRTQAEIAQLCVEQDELLELAGANLKESGSIVYLTCTLNPVENQERIDFFCQKHPEFRQEKDWQTAPNSPLKEFFWAARLRKK